jgi:CRISPR/Cas system-associated exonuclease Cas4 (RecB family)
MITEKDVYEMFAEIYYGRIYVPLSNEEIHVTEATQCLLKSFYQRKLQRVLLEPKMVVLSFGDLVHKALQEPLKRRDYSVEVEGRHTVNGVTLIGHTDALHSDHLLEIKTISRIPHDSLQHHRLQCNSYNFMFNKDIGSIIYIHKPSGTIRIFDVPKDEESFQYVCLRAYRLSACLKNNVQPKPEPSWLCSYCEYIDICPSPLKTLRKRWL